MHNPPQWVKLLLDAIQSPMGTQNVPHPYWKLLVEVVALMPRLVRNVACSPNIMTSLEAAKEWDKLECWMGVFWISWLLKGGTKGKRKAEDLRCTTLSLFHHQPGAIQKLEKWIEKGASRAKYQSKSFQQVCEQAHSEAAPQAAL